MATVTFTYLGKCTAADPHVYLRALVNGTPHMNITLTLSALASPLDLSESDKNTLATVFLRAFCRDWKAANPTGTIAQLKTALEAASWTV
jgi:hypothetical protein